MSIFANDGCSDASGVAPNLYSGRRAVLATMHGKEIAIAPAFRDRLGLAVELASGIDTDALGTFTGEIPRAGTIREAAMAKAHLGMAESGLAIGIASEGSYGPHPTIPFLPGGVELMVLVDAVRGITVTEHIVDDSPVFDHVLADDAGSISDFLERVRFPAHALIVRANEPDNPKAPIHKGLRTRPLLTEAIATSAQNSKDGRALVQTDMRAHMNPTRMATLGRLARRLCDRLTTLCPACEAPGFGQIDIETGLPCKWCGGPSIIVLNQVFGCVVCDHREKRPCPDGRTQADPGHCLECNP